MRGSTSDFGFSIGNRWSIAKYLAAACALALSFGSSSARATDYVNDAVESGSISFDVVGLSLDGPSTGTGDNDLFTFYQAPDNVSEPIGYSPWYRNNDMRAFVRMFTVPGDSIDGAMKLQIAGCPV